MKLTHQNITLPVTVMSLKRTVTVNRWHTVTLILWLVEKKCWWWCCTDQLLPAFLK